MEKFCENCKSVIENEIGSGRFCGVKCARSFASKAKRKEINEKVSKTLTGRVGWSRGRKLEKKLQVECQKCGELFFSVRKRKFCDKHPKGRDVKMPVPIILRTHEEQIKHEKRVNEWTPERRAKHSEKMKMVVKNNPHSYLGSNRGRVKQYELDGFKFHGNWEVLFYLWAKEVGLNPQKCLEGFPYEWNGIRQYYPDFYLPTLDIYVEVKGFISQRDRAKWGSFPKHLVVIRSFEIEKIQMSMFSINDLVNCPPPRS